MSVYFTPCVRCKHFRGNGSFRPAFTVLWVCDAYPRGIPDEYRYGEEAHEFVRGDEDVPLAWEPDDESLGTRPIEAWKRIRKTLK